MSQDQQRLRLLAKPRETTVELLFRMFDTALIPVEDVRVRLFRNLNADRFGRKLGDQEIPLPTTTLEDSNKAPRFIEIHHLAAYIEHRAGLADAELFRRLAAHETETA